MFCKCELVKCCICENEKRSLNVVNKYNGNRMCAKCAYKFKIIDKKAYKELSKQEDIGLR